jgi:hypothetical protein
MIAKTRRLSLSGLSLGEGFMTSKTLSTALTLASVLATAITLPLKAAAGTRTASYVFT